EPADLEGEWGVGSGGLRRLPGGIGRLDAKYRRRPEGCGAGSGGAECDDDRSRQDGLEVAGGDVDRSAGGQIRDEVRARQEDRPPARQGQAPGLDDRPGHEGAVTVRRTAPEPVETATGDTKVGDVSHPGSACRRAMAGSASPTESGRNRTANRRPSGRPLTPGSRSIVRPIRAPARRSSLTVRSPNRTPRADSV